MRRSLLYLLPLAFLGAFYLYPLLSIFDISLRPEGALDLSAFLRLLSGDYYLRTLAFTVYQALLSTALTILLALPCAFVFARYRFRGRSLLLALATLPFVLPATVVALAFAALLGDSGLLNDLLRALFTLDYSPLQLERSLPMILLAHVFYNFAIALRVMSSHWASLGAEAEAAAQCLGADEWALWRDIRLPLIRPAMLSAAVLVFIFCFTSFGVVLILGGIRFATLEVQIYYQAVSLFNLPMAAALSIVQIASMLLMMLLYTGWQRRLQSRMASARSIARSPRSLRARLSVAMCIVLILLLLAPLIALVERSLFVTGRFDASGYMTPGAALARVAALHQSPGIGSQLVALCRDGNRGGADPGLNCSRHSAATRPTGAAMGSALHAAAGDKRGNAGLRIHRGIGRTAAQPARVLADHPYLAHLGRLALCHPQRLA